MFCYEQCPHSAVFFLNRVQTVAETKKETRHIRKMRIVDVLQLENFHCKGLNSTAIHFPNLLLSPHNVFDLP